MGEEISPYNYTVDHASLWGRREGEERVLLYNNNTREKTHDSPSPSRAVCVCVSSQPDIPTKRAAWWREERDCQVFPSWKNENASNRRRERHGQSGPKRADVSQLGWGKWDQEGGEEDTPTRTHTYISVQTGQKKDREDGEESACLYGTVGNCPTNIARHTHNLLDGGVWDP